MPSLGQLGCRPMPCVSCHRWGTPGRAFGGCRSAAAAAVAPSLHPVTTRTEQAAAATPRVEVQVA
jgi:hypothetical protein